MATPHFEPVQGNEEILSVIDVCMKSFGDKSEQRIDLIPGGKYSCRLTAVFQRYFTVTFIVILPIINSCRSRTLFEAGGHAF
jgi:hypothetical protein